MKRCIVASLAALLITGNSEGNTVALEAGALLELTRIGHGWTATGLMQPRRLPRA